MTIKKNAKKNAVVVAVVNVPCIDATLITYANTINSMTPAMRNVLLDGFNVAAATKQLVVDSAFDACIEYIASIEDATSINTMLDTLPLDAKRIILDSFKSAVVVKPQRFTQHGKIANKTGVQYGRGAEKVLLCGRTSASGMIELELCKPTGISLDEMKKLRGTPMPHIATLRSVYGAQIVFENGRYYYRPVID